MNKKTVKPFVKWAGGKGQLLPEIQRYYPFQARKVTRYAEPFVGGGAVLFDILSKYELDAVYISDINADLVNAYHVIRDDVEQLVGVLQTMQQKFLPMNPEERKAYYLKQRERFNRLKQNNAAESSAEKAALLLFLNRTCFNGLFRVNKKGLFNVPMGAYKSPLICDADNLRNVSEKLQSVTIHCGDYHDSEYFIDAETFVYIDPPYRPISATASFTAYSENAFGDEAQQNLAEFVAEIHKKGAMFLVSNSDPTNYDSQDTFFDAMYSSYTIRRVEAARMINSDSKARGKIRELLISNL